MSTYSIVADQSALTAALALCRGDYQRNLLRGVESLSGSTLKGKARNWGGRYAEARRNILARMTGAGIAWCERKGDHGKRILVIGSSN